MKRLATIAVFAAMFARDARAGDYAQDVIA
jgi:hypothetical protein